MDPAFDRLLAEPEALALVRIEAAEGSSPRERGALMLVSAAASAGTIGGGRLELMAIERARAMLAAGEARAALSVPLGPAIGQCCGGFVRLSLQRLDAGARETLRVREAAIEAARPLVTIFGAGHVGAALARALLLLPLRVVLVDGRREFLDAAPAAAERLCLALPETALEAAPDGSAVVVLTHDHGLDFTIAAAALAAGRFSYVGMIGSATKRARFCRFVEDAGLPADEAEALRCPIGSGGGDKRPEVIAALAAAEIAAVLLCRDRSGEEMPEEDARV